MFNTIFQLYDMLELMFIVGREVAMPIYIVIPGVQALTYSLRLLFGLGHFFHIKNPCHIHA